MRLVFVLWYFVLSLSGYAMEDPDKEKKHLNQAQISYGSFDHHSEEESNSDKFEGVDIFIPGDSPFENFIVPYKDISSLVLAYLSSNEKINVALISKYCHGKLYPLIEFEVIGQKLTHYLQPVFFADRLPKTLDLIIGLFKRAETLVGPYSQGFKDLYALQATGIRNLKDQAYQAQDTPTVAFATKIDKRLQSNLDYLNKIDNYQSTSNSRWQNFCLSLPRDRRFLGTAGLIALGSFVAITYFITTEQVETQAYANFMNQREIPSFWDSREMSPCFQPCIYQELLDTFYRGSAFLTNHPDCENRPSRCPCPIEQCYSINNKNGTWMSKVDLYVQEASLSEWVDYMASQCHFIREPSGYWPQFIQEIVNKTRPNPGNRDVFQCAPNPDGETITCGSSWNVCFGQGGICMYLFTGSAVCAANEAWKAHLINYFVPTGLLMAGAIGGVLANWYCF